MQIQIQIQIQNNKYEILYRKVIILKMAECTRNAAANGVAVEGGGRG